MFTDAYTRMKKKGSVMALYLAITIIFVILVVIKNFFFYYQMLHTEELNHFIDGDILNDFW